MNTSCLTCASGRRCVLHASLFGELDDPADVPERGTWTACEDVREGFLVALDHLGVLAGQVCQAHPGTIDADRAQHMLDAIGTARARARRGAVLSGAGAEVVDLKTYREKRTRRAR